MLSAEGWRGYFTHVLHTSQNLVGVGVARCSGTIAGVEKRDDAVTLGMCGEPTLALLTTIDQW